MAIVLKPARGRSKGVVVFTHKERRFIDLQAPVLGHALERLRERFFVLMHWGGHVTDAPSYPAVDAHLCVESVVTFRDPGVRRIALNSAMFTPASFQQRPLVKHWDVISVTRALKQKCTGELLTCIRHLMDRRPETTAMVVCGGPADLNARGYENDLYERYLSMFSDAEREQFTFLYSRSSSPFQLPQRDIAFLYNSSRVFTLFSDTEGQTRVIKEALLCGLPILVKQRLQGGGRDYLSEENSRQFTSVEDGAARLAEMLDHPERFRVDTAGLVDQIGEAANIPRFVAAIRGLYDEAGIPFEGELDTKNLSRKFPAHVSFLPASMRSRSTDDLRSAEATLRFARAVTADVAYDAVSITPAERLLLRAFDRATTVRNYVERARKRLHL